MGNPLVYVDKTLKNSFICGSFCVKIKKKKKMVVCMKGGSMEKTTTKTTVGYMVVFHTFKE